MRRALSLALIVLACAVFPAGAAAQEQNDDTDAGRLVELLALREGSVVADVGAGSGALTLRLSPRVGPSGRVYSTDVNPQRLREIRDTVAQAALANVTVIEGGSAESRLPEGCCDAVFMRHVYHHVGDPARMNASLFSALRPGGRIAISDFATRSGKTGPPGRRDSEDVHGVSPDVVIQELRDAGFVDAREVAWPSKGGFAVTAQRP